MTQKITLILVSVVAVASAAVCGLMWNLAQDFQSAAVKAQEANQELIAQGQETNQELLKQNREMMAQLTTLANRPAGNDVISDWFPLKVRLVKNDEAKTPAEGFRVHLTGPHIRDGRNTEVEITADENGEADFGKVRSGEFTGHVAAPWGESCYFNVTIKPGSEPVKEIAVPAEPPEGIQAKPSVKWPKELTGKDIAVVVHVWRDDATIVDQRRWGGGGEYHLLIRPDGRFATYSHASLIDNTNRVYGDGNPVAELAKVEFASPHGVYEKSFPWPGKVAAYSEMTIVKLDPQADFPEANEELTCVSHLNRLEQFFGMTRPSLGYDEVKGWAPTTFQGENWEFQIPGDRLMVARAVLATDDFPDLSAESVRHGAMYFYQLDANNNGQLDKDEYDLNKFGLPTRIEEFPVTFNDFVMNYVKSPNAPGGFSRVQGS